MKIVKKVLIVIAILVVLVLLVALFLPSQVHVERNAQINAPDSVVYAYLIDFNNRTSWDPWFEMEPSAEVTISGSEKGVGARYAWKGEEIGSGEMTIVEVQENKSIKSRLVFIEPQSSESDVLWTLEGSENSTKITWAFDTDMGYPVERYFGLLMDNMLGPSFENGLSNLKNVIEQK
jgi:hypothetical protein